MHGKWALGWLIGLIIVVAVISVGCGGGEGEGGAAPPPPLSTATLTGTVVAADNTQLKFANAVITVVGTGRQGVTAADGSFTMQNLPVGTWQVEVQTPDSEQYGTATAQVTLDPNKVTRVNFAVLPLDASTPEEILLDPTSATVDLNGRVIYRTQLVGPNNEPLEGLKPTWVVSGGIGTVTPDGVFIAQTVGNGTVTAFAGPAQRTATVQVVAPRPPQISSFRVTPRTLPATGGTVFLSAAISDGDGIFVRDVTAEIYTPDNDVVELQMQVTNAETAIPYEGLTNCWLNASFGVEFQVPANDNQPTPDGVQAAEDYSARIIVRDRSGAVTESQFVDFTVEGIDAPPLRPPI